MVQPSPSCQHVLGSAWTPPPPAISPIIKIKDWKESWISQMPTQQCCRGICLFHFFISSIVYQYWYPNSRCPTLFVRLSLYIYTYALQLPIWHGWYILNSTIVLGMGWNPYHIVMCKMHMSQPDNRRDNRRSLANDQSVTGWSSTGYWGTDKWFTGCCGYWGFQNINLDAIRWRRDPRDASVTMI